MARKLPTKNQHTSKDKLAHAIEIYNDKIPRMRSGSPEHKIAKERLLFLLVCEQEKIAKALIRKAKAGDVKAIVEVFDRLYGKAKETIDLGGTVQFSLKKLAQEREALSATATIRDAMIAEEVTPALTYNAHDEEQEEHVSIMSNEQER